MKDLQAIREAQADEMDVPMDAEDVHSEVYADSVVKYGGYTDSQAVRGDDEDGYDELKI